MLRIMGSNSEFDEVVLLQNYNKIQNGLVTTLAAFLIYYVFWKRAKRTKNLDGNNAIQSQRRLPGPGQHFLGTLTNIYALRDLKKLLSVFDSWSRKYGPVYRLNFGAYKIIVLNSPDYVQKLLGSKDMNYLRKGFIYNPFKPFWNDGVIISKGEKWKFRRTVLEKHMFSYKTLGSYMNIFNKVGDNLVREIGKLFGDGKRKGIEHLLLSSSLDAITHASLGKSLDELESLANCESKLIETVNQSKEIIAKRVTSPWLLIDYIWNLHPLSKLGRLAKANCRKYALATVSDGTSTSLSLNKHGFGIKHDLMAAGVPIEGVIEEASTLISAGYDTTAISLHFLLFFLALHPRHQEMCREEVDSIFEDADFCPSGILQFCSLSKLKYLEMCAYETLRLLPTVFMYMRKPEAPLQLEDDLEIPAGSEVMIYVPGIHKNPKYFPDPDKFIPERFSQEYSTSRHPFAFIPFAAGPRKCIGYKFAMMEILIFAAKLLRSYEWETTEKLEDLVFLPYITTTLEKPINFLFNKRGTTQS